MKTLKIVDIYIQVALFVGIIATTIISNDLMFALLLGYFIIGGYQLAGMLIHEFNHWFTSHGTARRYYHNISYTMVIGMILTPVFEFAGHVFFLLLYLAPIMAIYYTWLCYKETFVYLKRPLSILK